MQLTVHLTPNAFHNKIDGWTMDVKGHRVLRVKVTAVPEDGKANAALIKLLAKTLHIAKSRIVLLRGATSRDKHLEIDIDEAEAHRILNEMQGITSFARTPKVLSFTL